MELWTTATPNGWKVSIMIEELRDAGVDLGELTVRQINLAKGEQHTAEFSAHNPNEKIPVLIDEGSQHHGELRYFAVPSREVPDRPATPRPSTVGRSAMGLLAGGQRRARLWQQTQLHPLHGLNSRRG
jgi:hypothetical protein